MNRPTKHMATWGVVVTCLLAAGAARAAEGDETSPGWVREDLVGAPVGWHGGEDAFVRALNWGVEQRFRNEFKHGLGFDHDKDDEYLLSRTRVWLEGQLGRHLDFRVEGRDARVWDAEMLGHDHPVFEDNFDLFQAYLTVHLAKQLKVRVGREMLAFDDQRLVGGFLWANTSRSFDTIHAIYENDAARVDLGVARVVLVKPDNANGHDHDDDFYYLHATAKKTPIEQMLASAFLYYRATKDKAFAQRDQFTAGARLWGKVPDTGFDYDFTGAYQFGEAEYLSGSHGDINAFALHGEVGHTFDAPWQPRWSVEGNWASGDSRPGMGSMRTFDQLFPTNHGKYGIADLVGWKNQRNVGTHLKAKPRKSVSPSLSYFAFWVDSSDDALYNAGGAGIVTDTSGASDHFVGHEIDAQIAYTPKKNVTLSTGIGYFFAEDYVNNNTAKGDDFVFGFLQLVVALN